MTVAAPIGAAIAHWVGPSWTLRLAFVIFAAGTVLAVELPEQVDSSAGEERPGSPPASPQRPPRRAHRAGTLAPASRASGPGSSSPCARGAAARWLAGFLTLFLAFRLRTEPLPGLSETASVGLVVAVAAVGSAVGSALGAVVRRARPEVIAVSLLTGTALVALWSAVDYGLWPVLTGRARRGARRSRSASSAWTR